MMRSDRREWEHLAREDAMWAVYSDPQRRGTWNEAEFFATGEAEIAGLLAGLGQHGITVRHGRALDFGCGLGRLTRALGSRFDEAVGVDISAEMVRRATSLNPGCRFVANSRPDLSVLGDERFDLVVSLIALQHVTSADIIRRYVSEFVRLTAPGGVLAFQIPERITPRIRLHPLRVANRALTHAGISARALTPWSMRLTALPEADVRAAVTAGGAEIVTSFPDRRTGTDHAPSRMYIAVRRASGVEI